MSRTQVLSSKYSDVLTGHSRASAPLTGILNKSKALMQRASGDLPILGKNQLNVSLLDNSSVEVSNKHSGIQRSRICLVCYITGLHFPGHPSFRMFWNTQINTKMYLLYLLSYKLFELTADWFKITLFLKYFNLNYIPITQIITTVTDTGNKTFMNKNDDRKYFLLYCQYYHMYSTYI